MKTEPDSTTIDKNDELENSSDFFKLEFSLKGRIRKSEQIKETVIFLSQSWVLPTSS